MVGPIQVRMLVIAEHLRPDTGVGVLEWFFSGGPLENKPGTAAAKAALRVDVMESRGIFRGTVKTQFLGHSSCHCSKSGASVSVESRGSWGNGS